MIRRAWEALRFVVLGLCIFVAALCLAEGMLTQAAVLLLLAVAQVVVLEWEGVL